MDESKFWSKVSAPNANGCREWQGFRMKHGYGRVKTGNGRGTLAHRLAWALTHGPIPAAEGHHGTLVVCHRCDNPPCCNPAHLFLGTQQDNIRDRDEKGRCGARGRVMRGEASGAAKLTDAAVLEIRAARASGATTVELGRQYGVSSSVISRAARGLTWSHL